MRIKYCIFFIMIAANSILAQEPHKAILKGKVSANTIDLEGIYVINLKTEKSTITENDGYFSIAAIPGDTLLFSSINLKEVRICLDPKDFQEELFVVKMETTMNQLKEVVVTRYDNINAVALGVSPSGMMHRTDAERRLYTAGDFKPIHLLGILGGSLNVDALVNKVNGRTAMIKKEIEVEKRLSFISQIENMFDEDYFKKVLKIPTEYIRGFKYYIVENEKFTVLLDVKNKTTIEFLMGELAIKYKEMISNEK